MVRNSPLAAEIDPKTFFMMLNANYAVLYRDELFDLKPLWEALSAQHSTPTLTGLFLRFAETLQKKGLQVAVPPQVADLTPEQQQMHLSAFEAPIPTSDAAMTGDPLQTDDAGLEAEVVPVTDELDVGPTEDAAPPMLELTTGDLRPYVEPEIRREIVQAVISSVRAAPVGERVDGSQLAYLVDNNFDALCDGKAFDLEPIFDGIRQLGNVFDRDLFLASALLQEQLRPLNLTVSHNHLDVSEAEGRQLLEQHDKARRELKLAVTHTADTVAPSSTGTTTDTLLPRAEARKTQLRRMGLGKTDKRVAQRIRIGVMAAVLAVVIVPSYLFRSTRPLSVSPYRSSIPLRAAELKRGVFIGRMDTSSWWPLPVTVRKERLALFEQAIREQGFAPECQVLDEKNRLVITSIGNGRLRGASLLMVGRADGTLIEKPDYSDAPDQPPPLKADEPSDEAAPDEEPEGDDAKPAEE